MKTSTETLFVGRERELDVIHKEWRSTQEEKIPRFLLVQGDFGSGKTALINKFLQNIESKNVLIGVARCALESEGNGLVPFVQLFQEISKQTRKLNTTITGIIEIISELAPAWIDVFTAGAATSLTEAAAKTLKSGRSLFTTSNLTLDNVFVQFSNFLSHLTKKHPAIIFIDDIHWADISSLSLLFHLSRYIQNRAILFILTYRPVEGLQTGNNIKYLKEIRANLIRYGALEIDLKDGLDVNQYIRARYPNNNFSSSLAKYIQEQCDGHALYTAQLFSWWEDIGAVYFDENMWMLRDNVEFIVPPSVGEVLEHRIQLMEENLRETLRVASVQGDDFTAQIIANLNNMNDYDVYNLLDLLEKKYKLVREDHKEELDTKILDFYHFLHRFFREHVYNNLNTGQKRVLHFRVANYLETLYEKNLAPVAGQLARHCLEANQLAKAVSYSLLASQYEFSRYAWNESQKWCEFGLSILTSHSNLLGQALEQFNLLEQLGGVSFRLGNCKLSHDSFSKALALSKKIEIDSSRLIAIYVLMVEIAENENDLVAANENLTLAMSLLSQLHNPPPDLSLKVQLAGAIIKIWTGDNRDAVDILRNALENVHIADLHFDSRFKVAVAYNYLATALSNLDYYQEASEAFHQMIAIAQQMGDRGLEALGLTGLVEDETYQGRFLENLSLINRAIDLAVNIGDRETESYALATRGHLLLKLGRYWDAIQSLNSALKICEEIKSEWNIALIYADLALAFLKLDDMQQAEEYSKRAIEFGRKGYKYLLGISLDVKGQVDAALGRWKQANARFEESVSTLAEAGDFHLAAIVRVHFAEALANQQETERARQLLDEAIKVLNEMGFHEDIQEAVRIKRSL